MPTVRFLPSGKSVAVPSGSALMDAARAAGAEIESPCGGKGVCGKCLVRIVSGDTDSDCAGILMASAIADGYTLACRTRIKKSDVVVEVPEALGREGGKFIEEDESYLVHPEVLPQQWDIDPLAIKVSADVATPKQEDGLGDWERLLRALKPKVGERPMACSLAALRDLAGALRAEKGRVTVTVARTEPEWNIVRVERGNGTGRNIGAAVDIGTTTISVQLIDIESAKILATKTAYNDQIACGLDVISRINYARRLDRLNELRLRVLKTINSLLEQVAERLTVDLRDVSNVVMSGNTTMEHLLLGLNPEYIRLDPYTPTFMDAPALPAKDVGVNVNPDAPVILSPNVGSYVGGDITAGLLCTEMAETDGVCLFIDVGTNAELVVGNRDFLMGCACSAGPAFEGGGIECGMRAAAGAIERVSVDAETGLPSCSVIGGGKPRGVCGSGMIDLLSNLYLTGWLDPAGRFDRSRTSPAIEIDGKRARYILAPASGSAGDNPIAVEETDIDNVIRAKAAIYSACSLLLNNVGVRFEDLKRFYIAGGFGKFLNLEQAITLGFLPDVPREKFHYIGNSSLTGSYMACVSREHRRKQERYAKRMTYLDLSNHPGYMDQYTAALFIPHTEPERFPSVKSKMIR